MAPDLILNVQVKPISGKFSWTKHNTLKSADRETTVSIEARRNGHHTRFLYRVKVYPKRPQAELCGRFGRVLDVSPI